MWSNPLACISNTSTPPPHWKKTTLWFKGDLFTVWMADFFLLSFSPFSVKKMVKRRKEGVFRKRRRGSVSKTHLFWYSISVCATDAGRDYFLSLPKSLFFFQSLDALRRCWSSFLDSGLPTVSSSISKLLDPTEQTVFSRKPGDCLSIWGMDILGTITALVMACAGNKIHAVVWDVTATLMWIT